MEFEEWVREVYIPTRQKMSDKVLARELPTESTQQQYEFQVLPAMSDKAATLRREATQYYRKARLHWDLHYVGLSYPKSAISTISKNHCGYELAVMQEAEDLLNIIRERRFDCKKLLFGFTEKDT